MYNSHEIESETFSFFLTILGIIISYYYYGATLKWIHTHIYEFFFGVEKRDGGNIKRELGRFERTRRSLAHLATRFFFAIGGCTVRINQID